MKNLKKLLGCVALVTFSMSLSAQEQVQGFVHQQSKATDYVWPTDQQVLDKLAKWQDQKFGVLFHWGLCYDSSDSSKIFAATSRMTSGRVTTMPRVSSPSTSSVSPG